MPRLRSTVVLATAALSLAGLTACGGDDNAASSDDYSVENMLAELPEAALEEGWVITTADLDRASELAEVDRPRPGSDDPDRVGDWSIVVSGIRSNDGDSPATVAALLPQAVNPAALLRVDEFRDELGWTVLDVSSFIEVSAPPDRFTVLHGEFDVEAIDDALGDRDDGIWSIGGDDYEVEVTEISAARPLGEALRLAEDDGTLVVSKSTDTLEGWLEDDDDETLADDEDFTAVAASLDDHDVYAAMLVEGSPLDAGGAILSDDPDAIDEAQDAALDRFDTLGVGLTVNDDGDAIAVFVYGYDTDDEAEDNVERAEALFDDGTSLVNGEPFSEYFDDAEVSVNGSTLVVTAELVGDHSPSLVWNMVFTRDLLTTHR